MNLQEKMFKEVENWISSGDSTNKYNFLNLAQRLKRLPHQRLPNEYLMLSNIHSEIIVEY